MAIKLEHHSTDLSLLNQEADIYNSLRGRPGIPQVFWCGHHSDFRIMVFELLGPNLEDLLRYCGGRFSMKTTLMLVDQLLRRIECLHTTDYRHRDIKPENFLLGMGKRGNVVYMTDLGLADYRPAWHDSSRNRNPSQTPRLSLVGTCRYASINGHLAVGKSADSVALYHWLTPSRPASSCCDDLESLGYMALYFLRGSLPWQGLQACDRQTKEKLVLQRKQQTGVEELCRDLPVEFATYMSYLRQLKNPNGPNYAYLRGLFGRLFKRLGFEYDHIFDWTVREFERLSRENNAETQTSGRVGAEMAGRGRRGIRQTRFTADKR